MSSLLPDPPAQPEEEQGLSTFLAEEEVVPGLEEQPVALEAVSEAPREEPEKPADAEENREPNGGPLGCCLGVVVGLLLSLTIAVLSRFYGDTLWNIFGSNLGLLTRILMSIVGLGAAILCGIIGWRVGRRFYREYEPGPRQRRKLAELEQRDRARYDRYRRKTKRIEQG